MTIEALAADPQGRENMERWAANGLPVPPSWRVDGETVRRLGRTQLETRLHELADAFPEKRYWVLHRGRMGGGSQRDSLLNLDSPRTLATTLTALFNRDDPPQEAVFQALPHQYAAGILFTRHPLRPDLSHVVAEGVVAGDSQHQRLVLDVDGTALYRDRNRTRTLDTVVPVDQLLTLASALRTHFERPQAAEWMHDGERLWLLQTLPIGSLPGPGEAWTRGATSTLFNQAVTPLWYTLAGRWLKTGFWWPLVEAKRASSLAKVEPYRRQRSHLYVNSEFFRRLLSDHPGSILCLPPAWRPSASPARACQGVVGAWPRRRLGWRLTRLTRTVSRWRLPLPERESLWRALMALDRCGEKLAGIEGELAYVHLPDHLLSRHWPVPLRWVLSGEERAVLQATLNGNRGRCRASMLRPGADPVHAPLHDQPAQLGTLRAPSMPRQLADGRMPGRRLTVLLEQARQARLLRLALGNRVRAVLTTMSALLAGQKSLAHPDDVFFLYFDELWELWVADSRPRSASAKVLAGRKAQYLRDAQTGAPRWKLDGVGFGAGTPGLPSILRGASLQPGHACGPLRRLGSAWDLHRLSPGDIIMVDQVDPSWVPWLAQAGALAMATRDPLNGAAALAVAAGIPAVWGVSDLLHNTPEGQIARLDGAAGTIEIIV